MQGKLTPFFMFDLNKSIQMVNPLWKQNQLKKYKWFCDRKFDHI